jgi:cell division septum initiation protein DivIVA
MPVKRSRGRPPLPRGVRWLMFRRRIRRMLHPFAHRRVRSTEPGAPIPSGFEPRGGQDQVDRARERAQHIEQEAVDWAEHLISTAQQRATDIVAAAEDRAEDLMARSSRLTRGYLRDVFELLDAALPPEETAEESRRRRDTAARLRTQRDWAAESGVRANLGIVPPVPDANEGA